MAAPTSITPVVTSKNGVFIIVEPIVVIWLKIQDATSDIVARKPPMAVVSASNIKKPPLKKLVMYILNAADNADNRTDNNNCKAQSQEPVRHNNAPGLSYNVKYKI